MGALAGSAPLVWRTAENSRAGSRKSSSSREYGRQRPDFLYSARAIKKSIKRNRIFAFKRFLMMHKYTADNGREKYVYSLLIQQDSLEKRTLRAFS